MSNEKTIDIFRLSVVLSSHQSSVQIPTIQCCSTREPYRVVQTLKWRQHVVHLDRRGTSDWTLQLVCWSLLRLHWADESWCMEALCSTSKENMLLQFYNRFKSEPIDVFTPCCWLPGWIPSSSAHVRQWGQISCWCPGWKMVHLALGVMSCEKTTWSFRERVMHKLPETQLISHHSHTLIVWVKILK